MAPVLRSRALDSTCRRISFKPLCRARATSALSKALAEFKGLTISLTFLDDGLHSVVALDRK
jgi:hypothetical protein